MTQYNVLILDDEPEIGKLLASALEGEGHRPLCVETVASFKDAMNVNSFDVFLIDIGLPDGNGLDLIRKYASDPKHGVIVLSGRGSELDQVLGLEIGADDYITKPFRPREVVARINSVMRRVRTENHNSQKFEEETLQSDTSKMAHAEKGGAVEEFDGYRLEVDSRQLFSPEDEEIFLTTSEFNLLEALLKRRGQVLNRDQLMNAVKGRDWESYDRAIDGLVSRLRRKIPAPDNRTHYIRTVHGIGYSFSIKR